MPCNKLDCNLKQACFEVYGKFAYPPCASEQGESPATDRQQLKAEIATIATEFDTLGPGSCGGEHLKSFYDLVIKLRQLSAV